MENANLFRESGPDNSKPIVCTSPFSFTVPAKTGLLLRADTVYTLILQVHIILLS